MFCLLRNSYVQKSAFTCTNRLVSNQALKRLNVRFYTFNKNEPTELKTQPKQFWKLPIPKPAPYDSPEVDIVLAEDVNKAKKLIKSIMQVEEYYEKPK